MSGPVALLLLAVAVPLAGLGTAALIRLGPGRRRQWSLGWAASTLCGIVGAAIGSSVTGLAIGRPLKQVPVLVVLGAVAGTVALLLVGDLLARRRASAPTDARALMGGGESAQVEFKSSARYNRHTGGRDPRLEQVIATSAAAFFNARGGTLLVGVADDGRAVGVEADYALLRNRGRDGYELWLHDLFSSTLGAAAAATVRVSFEEVDGVDVCLIRVPPAPRPVYLQTPKQRGCELVVRIGNSSRRLDARESVEYAVSRWGGRALRGVRRGGSGKSSAAPPVLDAVPDAGVAG
jgi:uncharacterized membrane protein YeaQ/YmgE (transglycosylase-associated protein family)